MRILSVNCGSSSLKFALYSGDQLIIKGKEDLHRFSLQDIFKLEFDAVGHRIVHGGPRFQKPCLITPQVLEALRELSPFDPDHLPEEIHIIESVKKHYPKIPQVACFDTAFHASMPSVAKYYPIPRKFWNDGIYHYGFHGLSYEYIMQALPQLSKGKYVIAHLGNGCSMAAIQEGVCIDTSMGFTPTGGLMMSSRTGDLDPGVALYLQRKMGIKLEELTRMFNKESGLLAVSELSSDMQELLEAEGTNTFAADAIAMFCYHAKKYLGAYQAVLGGLDGVVFTGGIGENSAVIRERICLPGVPIHVIETNEELMIARHTEELIKNT